MKQSASYDRYENNENLDIESQHQYEEVTEDTLKRKSYQFRALIRKNTTLQSRQMCTNCCQLSVPLILVSLVGLIQILYNYYVIDAYTAGIQINTYPTLVTFNNGSVFPNTRNYTDRWNYYTLWQSSFNATIIGNLTQDGVGNSGLVGNITQLQNTTEEAWGSPNITFTPWYQAWDTFTDMNNELETQKNYWVQRQLANQRYPRCLTCPQSATIFNDLVTTPSNISIDYAVMIDTQLGYSPIITWHTMINMIDSAFMKLVSNNPNYYLITFVQELPFIEQVPQFDIASFLSVLLYPFAISFVLPVYVNSIVVEKQERLREMMKMMGLKMVYYWITNYIWDMILYILIVAVLIISSLVFSLRMFTQTSFILLLLMFFGWGNAMIALGFLLSTFFKRGKSATVVTYLIVIASVIISYVLNATVFKEDQTYIFFLLYPAFACYRAIFLIGIGCSVLQCPELSDLVWGSQMLNVILFLYIDTVLYFIIALYLDAVIPSEFGVPKHPLFPLIFIRDKIRKYRNPQEADESATLLNIAHKNDEQEDDEEDLDVREERKRVYENNIPSNSPVIITDLHKRYQGSDKIAVKNITFHIEKGECFGLLGPNGAGKTTTISMLTGLFPPTSGTAKIAGFDIRKDMDSIHRIMSVCPQFDTLWMDLTCLETVLFYARLKGVSSADEKKESMNTLTKVGLEQYSNRKAKELSGGMRRRLSIAVSLIGNPVVVFLDEPTTGLDPETRRHLWDVMLEITKGRSVILTTHSMEEADILSSRIGIMSKGELRCIGPQLHLKNRHGAGYSLHINTHFANESNVERFVNEIIPEAQLTERLAGNLSYNIAINAMRVSELFEQMESNKQRIGIQDWGVTQTTIEDVFLKIVKDDEKEEYLMKN